MNNVGARIVRGSTAAGFVFACFASYAFLSPATFRSSAVVVLSPAGPKRDALELSLDLERALLEPEFLRKLAGEVAPSLDRVTLAETVGRIRSALEVDSPDGSRFVVAFTDSSSARAQWIRDIFARRAVEQLPRVSVPTPGAQPSQAARDLAAFLARHPELSRETATTASAPPATRNQDTKESGDRFANALRTERWRLASRLSELSKASASDNPYGNEDPKALRTRIAEIDAALSSPHVSVGAKSSAAEPADLREQGELRRLLSTFERENARQGVEPPAATVSARVVIPAKRATQPISPARSLLLWLGALLGTALGTCVALLTGPRPDPRPRERVVSREIRRRTGTERLPAIRHDTFPIPIPLVRHAAMAPIPLRSAPSPQPVMPVAKVVDLPPAAERGPASSRRREQRRTLVMGSVQVLPAAGKPVSEPSPDAESDPPTVRNPPNDVPASERNPEARSIISYSELVEQSALVAPYDVPLGWHPDSSLDVAHLRSMARDLYPLATERPFVLAVTATSGAVAAKSRTAAELALALAEFAHRRVLLLEGNFTRPAIQRWMRLKVPNACGFTRQLQAYAERRLYGGWKVARCTQWLDVCAEGAVRTPGAILNEHFVNALGEFERHYGFIVIDGPSLDDTSDCRALDKSVEGVVVVRDSDTILSHARLSSLFGEKRFSTVIETAA